MVYVADLTTPTLRLPGIHVPARIIYGALVEPHPPYSSLPVLSPTPQHFKHGHREMKTALNTQVWPRHES